MMPLPLRYVDEIHARLAIRYGSAWTAKWSGLDERLIKADWSEQLDNMAPESIRKALDFLPDDFPPTATAFRKLGAIRTESVTAPALPAPDPVGMKRVAGEMARLVHSQRSIVQGAADCFARLRQLEREGRLSPAQRDFLRRANFKAAPVSGDFSAIEEELLPEGMQ